MPASARIRPPARSSPRSTRLRPTCSTRSGATGASTIRDPRIPPAKCSKRTSPRSTAAATGWCSGAAWPRWTPRSSCSEPEITWCAPTTSTVGCRATSTTYSRTTASAFTYVDSARPETVRQAIRPETKMLWVETPSNPLLKITDVEAMSVIAKEGGNLPCRRFDVRDPRLPAPAGAGRGHRHAQHHEVPERTQPDHRGGVGHRPGGPVRSLQVHPEDHRRGAGPPSTAGSPCSG